ncbi:CBS domain-containing protein [Pelagibacteraceae bacterium]|jgi:CBS-domain-containing membrane protein|nr:CBS domain-containing protein [Pelagibacteraceae bacterium]|tara:strand:+ start:1838 stop:2437 length:600 start_codon:yes stop_codon:yes gene_type:complete
MKIGLLRGLKDIKENISFNLETPISEIAAVIKEKSIGAVPIIDDQNKLIGIVSERDIVTKMVVEARDADLTTAQEIMTKEIISANLDDDLEQTIGVMKSKNIRHMPVTDSDGKLTDFFSIRDFLNAEIKSNQQVSRKHKNVVKYQITASVLLVIATFAGVFFDYFDKKNIIMILSVVFLIIGMTAVMTIRTTRDKSDDY